MVDRLLRMLRYASIVRVQGDGEMRRAAMLSVSTLALIAACTGSSGPRKLGGELRFDK